MTFHDPQPFSWHFAELSHHFQFEGHGLFLILIFFCLIFMMTSLFLYIHWVCHARRHNLSVTPADPNMILTSSGAPVIGRSLGLDAATINSLPITLHCTSTAAKGMECSICLGVFEEDEKVKVLPKCNHTYHSECVDEWLSSQSSCPLCRASLKIGIPDLEAGLP